jgi:hypothetical protein
MDKSISDSSISRAHCDKALSSPSRSLYSNSLSCEVDRDPGCDLGLDPARLGEPASRSLPLFLLRSFFVLDVDLEVDLLPLSKTVSLSMADIVVATVTVEFERDENCIRLSPAVIVV